MRETKPSLPKVVDDCHELLKWIIPQLDKFPRNRRFTLGERIEKGLIEVLEECIEAAYRRDKSHNLAVANRNSRTKRNNNIGFRLAQSARISRVMNYHGNHECDQRVSMSLLPGLTGLSGRIVR